VSANAECAVPLLSLTKENVLLRHLTSKHYDKVFVVSDLHLGEGQDRWTKTYTLRENFLADAAFGQLLTQEDPWSSLLILNGDTFDCLRVTDVPRSDDDFAKWAMLLESVDLAVQLKRPIPDEEVKFGMRTDDYKSIWKLDRIIAGHSRWWQTLVLWVGNGGHLIFVKGNHDLELHWEFVRRFLRLSLVDPTRNVSVNSVSTQVAFAESGLTIGNIYVEHGHQYEHMTMVDGSDTLPGNKSSQLRLPLGSFINRYFINRLESLAPFIDNIKPVHKALMSLVRQRPIALGRIYTGGYRFLLRILTVLTKPRGIVALGLWSALLVPPLAVVVIIMWFTWPAFQRQLIEWLPSLRSGTVRVAGSVGGITFPALVPYVIAVGSEFLRMFGWVKDRDKLEEAAVRLLAQTWPQGDYVVMGHTHRQTVRRVRTEPHDGYYINTGTWIGLWPLDRIDLSGKFIYSFARFSRTLNGVFLHEALVWDDEAGEIRPATIQVPDDQ